jgi:hypothetical protein
MTGGQPSSTATSELTNSMQFPEIYFPRSPERKRITSQLPNDSEFGDTG